MEDKFSSREVAVMFEELRREFRVVSEVVVPLREDVSNLREDMVEVKDRLTRVEDGLSAVAGALKSTLPSLTKRVDRIEAKLNL